MVKVVKEEKSSCDDEEISESVNSSGRLRQRTDRSRDHINRYEKELQYFSADTQVKDKEKKEKQVEIKMNDMFRKVVGITMTQLSQTETCAQISIKEGIRIHGDKVLDAVLKEYSQLDNKEIFYPQNAKDLTKEVKRTALNLITMVKEKRGGRVKDRAHTDGRKQRKYIAKDDVMSPIAQLESILLSLLVGAHEGSDVATTDVVGAYMLVDMEDYVLVKLSDEVVNIMCNVNNRYIPFVAMENDKKVLYMRLTKVLNGCI